MLRKEPSTNWLFIAVGAVVTCACAAWVARYVVASSSVADSRTRSPAAAFFPALRSTNSSSASASETALNAHVAHGADPRTARQETVQYAVTVNKPAGPPRVDLGVLDEAGQPVTAACSTCHTTRPPNYANRQPADLDEYHQSLVLAHGDVSCLSCHNPADYDTLRLADATPVAYAEVMDLCSQCHGPQARDYRHGAHGGMNGYWDLSRGPRTRNNCVDCHDPHAPRFPTMQPTFKPRDRFLTGAG